MVTPHSMLLRNMKSQQEETKSNSPCHIVVDSGFSFTNVVPFFNGIPMKQASLRLDVGGKLLTNLLTEQISQKDFNLQGEFGIVNDIKEKTCFFTETKEQFSEQME